MTVPKPRSHNVPYFSRVLPKSMLQTWTGGGGGLQIQNCGHESRRFLPLILKHTHNECVGSSFK